MNVLLFQGGAAGALHTVAEDEPLYELEELLGGPLETVEIGTSLRLLRRADGEAERLPIRYVLRLALREPEPIAGDCAVVSVYKASKPRAMKDRDVALARECVRRVGGAG
ncbi:MAG: hypothetical protein LUG13_04435 [Oscillospiraceae bacterium]|nr:hypothetical protein [Oscillospiraceae bacterium]